MTKSVRLKNGSKEHIHCMLCNFKIHTRNHKICIPALTTVFLNVFSYLQSAKCFEAQLQIMLWKCIFQYLWVFQSYDFFYSSFWCPSGSQLIFYVISFQAALPAVQVLCRKPLFHLGFLTRSKPVLSWGECTVPLQCNATYFNGEVSIPQENMLQHVHWQTLRLPSASTLPSAGLGTEDSHCWWQQHCFVIKGFSAQASFRLTCCYTEQTIFCEFFLTRFFKLLFMGLNTAWWRNNTPQSPC